VPSGVRVSFYRLVTQPDSDSVDDGDFGENRPILLVKQPEAQRLTHLKISRGCG
jgi:hypothetical protein